MWGWNYKGVVGNENTGGTHGFAPAKLMDDVVSVSLGYLHAAAIKRDGSLWTWGDNSHGELGDGTTESSTTPVKVMDGVSAVSLGGSHTGVIMTDGSLLTWGCNDDGQLGNETTCQGDGRRCFDIIRRA